MSDDVAEYLLVTGPSGGGKERYVETLAAVTPGSVMVSLESVAALIAEELKNDQSDFIEGGVDTGRTVGEYLTPPAPPCKGGELPSAFADLLQGILHRGLKYLSTGEIRRTMLCRALLQKPSLLILCDPFAGLDAATQTLLADFLTSPPLRGGVGGVTRLVLCMPPVNIPANVTRVREFTGGKVSFDGPIASYQMLLQERAAGTAQKIAATRAALQEILGVPGDPIPAASTAPLIEMHDVNVGWGEKRVLCHLNWTVFPGEHWLIRGPNGAGKTTLLELITGDNMQVFSNDVSLFGKRRGSGETLWDIRSRLGIVSHRLHLEYRRVGDTPLDAVLVSGFYDSIGLYEAPGDREKAAAKQWLALAGLEARSNEPFKALSYGEQRVALILRGAVKSPPLLILDEPCHGLDTEGRSLVLDLMDTVAALGASTILHVTHDPTEVRPFAQHVLEMKIEG